MSQFDMWDIVSPPPQRRSQQDRSLVQSSLLAFERARLLGLLCACWAWVLGRRTTLLTLTLHQGKLLGASDEGLKSVRVSQIVGSDGRTNDYDACFRPRNECLRTRWAAIHAASISGQALPPVKLVRVGENYYVRDGHHRVSVAKYLGQLSIDAEVIGWQIRAQAPDLATASLGQSRQISQRQA